MVQKRIIAKRIGVILGLFGLSVTLVVFAVYGAIRFIEKMGWL